MATTKWQNAPTVNGFMRAVASFVIWAMGWRMEGLPPDRAKMVMIGGPHTSNLDVFLMIMMSWKLGLKMSYLVANDLSFPLNKLSIWANGIPIDRNSANNRTVDQVVDYMHRVDRCVLMIAPEGRLKRMEYWRSGFYYIALGANLPIVPGYMDYKNKLIKITDSFEPTGDIDADMERIRPFFEEATARFPEKVGPIRVRPRTDAMNKRLADRATRRAESVQFDEQDDDQQERAVGD